MGLLRNRIGRGIAVAVAAAIPASVMAAAPAHAADHFHVDTDSVVVGTNGTNNYKAFDGSVESWHDGTRLRATLKGTYVGRGSLKVRWHYAGGGESDLQDVVYSAGVQKDVPGFTSPSDKDVVRFDFVYFPNSGSIDSLTRFVGDEPQSVGSCVALDEDTYDITASGVNFHGTATYQCTSDGQIFAHITGTLSGPSDSTDWGTAALKAAPTFADHSETGTPVTITTVSGTGPRSTGFDVTTNLSKDVRTLKLIVSHGTESSQTKQFGDG